MERQCCYHKKWYVPLAFFKFNFCLTRLIFPYCKCGKKKSCICILARAPWGVLGMRPIRGSEARKKRAPFSGFRHIKRVWFSRVEGYDYEWVRKAVISVFKRSWILREYQTSRFFMAVKGDSAFTPVIAGTYLSKSGCLKGLRFFIFITMGMGWLIISNKWKAPSVSLTVSTLKRFSIH